jgi:hypothetical protein
MNKGYWAESFWSTHQHYFVNGKSLCGGYGKKDNDVPHPPSDNPVCDTCLKLQKGVIDND